MRVIDFFDRGCGLDSSAPAFVMPDGTSASYGELREAANRVAAALVRKPGAAPHVAVYSPNDWRAFLPILAAFRAGGVWVPINARNALCDNVGFMSVVEVDWLFYHSSFSAQVAEIRRQVPSIRRLICLDREDGGVPSLDRLMAEEGRGPVPDLAEDADREAVMMQTGGTTGTPKAVVQSEGCWETMIALGWQVTPFEGRPVHLMAAPMTHGAGFLAYIWMAGGATNIVLDRVDPGAILDAIEQHRITHMYLPPTALYSLLAYPGLRERDVSSLRYFIISAAPVNPDKLREAVEVFGPCLCQTYGQAESPAFLTWLTPAQTTQAARDPAFAHRLRSCGRSTLLSRVEVLNDAGQPVALGELGEICMKGGLRMLGYYRNPAATAEVRDAAGWQHTGDIGYRDADGFFYIVDRKKDMIVTGGFNVFSAEVERALGAHPAVRDCAVYGVPSEKWGEAVHATVELKSGATVSAQELILFAKERVGGVKAPKSLDFIDSLPRSPVGKVLKRALREPHWAGRDRAVG
ncbi:MAG: AMP-binding protein [Ideonella sp.]|nr:AMP-binding protein [Ideonella sp.]MCC7458974.1 AMP-binding protein [Nitrospira sp.]